MEGSSAAAAVKSLGFESGRDNERWEEKARDL